MSVHSGVRLPSQHSVVGRLYDALFRLSMVGVRRHCPTRDLQLRRQTTSTVQRQSWSPRNSWHTFNEAAVSRTRRFSKTAASSEKTSGSEEFDIEAVLRGTPNSQQDLEHRHEDSGGSSISGGGGERSPVKLEKSPKASDSLKRLQELVKQKEQGVRRRTGRVQKGKHAAHGERDRSQLRSIYDPLGGIQIGKSFWGLRARALKVAEAKWLERQMADAMLQSKDQDVSSGMRQLMKAVSQAAGSQRRWLPEEPQSQLDPLGSRRQQARSVAQDPLVEGHTPRPYQPDKPTGLTTEVRGIFRAVPTSVVALTTAVPSNDSSYNAENARGIALSSLTTVTMGSSPVLSFNIKTPSHTLDALKVSRQFLVHFLLGNTPGARIADDLTQGLQKQTLFKGFNNFYWKGTEVKPVSITSSKKEHIVLPLLYGFGLKGPVLRCEILREGFIPVGDHEIVLARVVEVLQGDDGSNEAIRGAGSSLAYSEGNFYSFSNGSEKMLSREAHIDTPKRDRVLKRIMQADPGLEE